MLSIEIDFEDKSSVKKGLKNFSNTLDKFYKKKYFMEDDEIHILDKNGLIKNQNFQNILPVKISMAKDIR